MKSESLPFLPFTRPNLDEETIAGVVDTLRSGWISSGPKVKVFEVALSEYFGGRVVRTFSNGTATLEAALRIAGVGPGDEVITTPISWVATTNVILETGATPVFADIDPVTRNLDLAKVEAAITPRTKVLLPVYLAGLPMDMDALYALVAKHKLRVVEDAAQAIGSTWKGKRIGAFGDLVSFSFQANKNLTSAEGGCLVMDTPEQALHAEKLRLQGVVRSGYDGMEVDMLGNKANLSDVHAAIGLGQLARIGEINARRHALARRYFALFKGAQGEATRTVGMELPPENFTETNWHMFQVVLPLHRLGMNRAAFMEKLHGFGVGAGVHYPPIHLFKLYRGMGFKEGMFPVSERIGAAIVSLPLFASMRDEDPERVVAAVNQICAETL
ncbi:MAG: DegT/DnrJ/EryC1/StrS aminotransferase family protein [Candidatus Protistobacter heckmanni]|nr:DegT/DnrJ/EryC1/StrS aminotransferase family protein [Candidatus Protistobacter heckmanni]